jgi:hypothetical protein
MRPESPDDAGALTRRRFLEYTGATAAYLSLWTLPGAAAAAPPSTGLEPQDQATFKALYEGLALRPGYPLNPARADAATTSFADQFAEQPDETRQQIVTVLRLLEQGPPRRGFSELDPSERLDFLRRWSNSNDRRRPSDAGDRAKFAHQATRDRLLAATLAQLVLVRLDVDPLDEFLARQPIEAI